MRPDPWSVVTNVVLLGLYVAEPFRTRRKNVVDPYPGRHQWPDPIEKWCLYCDRDAIHEVALYRTAVPLWECIDCGDVSEG